MLDEARNKTVVLGLGNPLMRDEGIGTVLIEKLSALADEFGGIDFIDAGTGGMSILYLIEGREKVIIIDCAYMNSSPGTIKKFRPDQVRSVKKLAHQSLHEVDILKVIELAKQLDNCPPDIIFFGIEPEKIEQGQGLTDTLTEKMQSYMDTILAELG
jgi:hydrogenase maturation protease